MNFKDLILPLILALSTTFLIQHFISKKYGPNKDIDQVKTGQRFTAPKNEIVQKPLNLEVDFIDYQSNRETIKTEVETSAVNYVFTNDGAGLESYIFKKYVDNKEILMETISKPKERENLCFLLALNEKTPYYYDLVERIDTENYVQIKYRAEKASFSHGSLEKTFKVYKDSNKIDLNISFEPKSGFSGEFQPRIFFPSPVMKDIKQDNIRAIVWENKLKQLKRDKKLVAVGWQDPEIFGSEDTYFIHSLVSDPDNFIKRGYYRLTNVTDLFSILEGPSTNKKSSWNISFYFGPKDVEAMAKVDSRLEGALDYGMLSFLAKLLLALLKFLNKYFKNYGISVIVLTLVIRLVMLPFTYKGEKGMKERVEFQKKLDHLQRKYKNDKDALAMAKADLIKKHGMPGLSGCLPLLLQFPIFIALSSVLRSSVELYKAPFFLWIKDLSAKDPYYVLPIIAMIFMLWQTIETADSKNRLPGLAMALVFGAALASFSAGLVLYILVTTILGILQTKMITSRK